MTDIDNAAHVIRDLAITSAQRSVLEPGKIYAYPGPDGPHTIDLSGDEHLDLPRRKSGTVTVTDVASFAHYYAKHADEHSEIFAHIPDAQGAAGSGASVTAVLDAHTGAAARWQEHRLVLQLQVTPEWRTWAGNDRRMMSQATFAEFIEDYAADVAPDSPCSGADLLEVAQEFHARTRVEFKSGHRTSSGQAQLQYVETTDATAGTRGTLTIPTEFALGLRVYADLQPYRVRARFRYRITDGKLTLGYHLDNPERLIRDAVDLVVGQAEEQAGVVIMRGRP